ncbi:hypothetical protein NE236_16040 [Actinoallomurus purpureus]|uniref:hypothetical protein n=1 Tax=Actinoallomurus purpureus TaxID=478114 RepID=UPI0020930A71|nr:hypothetical protein [Actinoallomurus purpureus]MCO6006497.1 hypothetical protein [Actinoallomurus purpureus]
MTLLTALSQSTVSMAPQAGAVAGGKGTGGFGIRLAEAPVARRHDPRARTGIVDHLAPGTTIKRRVELSSTFRKALHVQLYAAAATIAHHRFTITPDRTPNELTTWTSLDQPAVTLSAFGKKTARVTIRVPATASQGERYGVIWAQVTARPDAKHNVGVTNRVGIPIYLDIGPGGEPPSDLRIEKLTPARAEDGRPRLVAQVHNTGGRALDVSGTLWLSDGPGGLRAGPYAATLGVTLPPGDTAPVMVVLDRRMPNGPWKARLTLRSGMVSRTVSATVSFPDKGTGTAIALTSNSAYTVPALAGLVIVVGGVPLFLLRRRSRTR